MSLIENGNSIILTNNLPNNNKTKKFNYMHSDINDILVLTIKMESRKIKYFLRKKTNNRSTAAQISMKAVIINLQKNDKLIINKNIHNFAFQKSI